MFLKRASLIIVALLIIYFSNTPGLQVANPSTWINAPRYVENLAFFDIFREDSAFYNPYSNIWHLNFFLHKISHITFYSLLTYLLFINLRDFKGKYFIVWVFITIFAFSDEIHQFYIIGRSGRLLDIGLDSISSLITLLIIYVLSKYKKDKKMKTNTSNVSNQI